MMGEAPGSGPETKGSGRREEWFPLGKPAVVFRLFSEILFCVSRDLGRHPSRLNSKGKNEGSRNSLSYCFFSCWSRYQWTSNDPQWLWYHFVPFPW